MLRTAVDFARDAGKFQDMRWIFEVKGVRASGQSYREGEREGLFERKGYKGAGKAPTHFVGEQSYGRRMAEEFICVVCDVGVCLFLAVVFQMVCLLSLILPRCVLRHFSSYVVRIIRSASIATRRRA